MLLVLVYGASRLHVLHICTVVFVFCHFYTYTCSIIFVCFICISNVTVELAAQYFKLSFLYFYIKFSDLIE